MVARPRRSALYVPGSNARALAKARGLAADAIVIDLEDSVAPALKPTARALAAEAARAGGFGGREVVIRVNGPDTPWGREDMEAAIAAAPDAILLPKGDGPGAVMVAARALREAGAVHFLCSPRGVGLLARLACRHLAQIPSPPQTLTERIWTSLPWGERGTIAQPASSPPRCANGREVFHRRR